MIAYLEGTIIQKSNKTFILKSHSVGYLVYVPSPLFDQIELGQMIELFIYTKVREDDISLYGFNNLNQLEFFKDLISVNGIGPKLGLEILSSNVEKTKQAILQENAAYLSKIPGIGKKTAERIIVELKNKLTPFDLSEEIFIEEPNFDNVITALNNLGYQKFEIVRVLKMLPKEITDPEEMITYFLKNI
jgi:Holliday junction DNA helicase RuvA